MLSWIRRFLSLPPVTQKGPYARQAALLHYLLITIGIPLILASMAVTWLFAYNPLGSFAMLSTLLMVLLIAFILLRSNRVRASAFIVAATGWSIAILYVLFSGGMTSAGLVYLITATTLSGVLLGERAAIAVTCLSALASLWILGAEITNAPAPRLFVMSPLMGWVALVACLVMTTSLTNYAVRHLLIALRLAEDQIQARRRAEDELRRLAVTDELTGLYNRRYFFDSANQLLTRAKAEKISTAVIMIDLDHFKDINDTSGHSIGDQVLAHVARLLSQSLRSSDVVARYGGEEFAAFVPGVSASDAMDLAERMRASIVAKPFETSAGQRIVLSASVGLVVCDLTKMEMTLDQLMKDADEALYKAKANGRNFVFMEHRTAQETVD